MKNFKTLLGSVIVISSFAFAHAATAQSPAKGQIKLFSVYSDKGSPGGNFFIPSGWMGDSKDVTLNTGWTENPESGTTCIKVVYNAKASGGNRWAGVYWQNPANNWGDKPNAGMDLTGITKLTFWARGEKGGEVIQEVKVGGINGTYPDSDEVKAGPITLTSDWKQYTIDLTGKNLTHIIGGFAWATNLDVNPEGCTFYLDDIQFE